MIRNNLLKTIILLIFFIGIATISYGKYTFEQELEVANLDIDRTKPKVTYTEITNTNTNYEKYANKTHTITIKIEVEEKNIGNDTITAEELLVKIAEEEVKPDNVNIAQTKKEGDKVYYQIELQGLKENGLLKVEVLEGAITDTAGWKNEKFIIDTQIIIDNIAPTGIYSQKSTELGKMRAYVAISEAIRTQNGWNMTDGNTGINKEFSNNVCYELPIIDYAGNKGIVIINVTEATRLEINYASYNSKVGWLYADEQEIAGRKAVQANPIYKTEALAVHVGDALQKDYINVRTYIYTHWGEGSKAECETSGIVYSHGYNPSSTTWKNMTASDLVTMNGKKYFQFGGSTINKELQTDIDGNNPIPSSYNGKYLYGVSGLSMSLIDYNYYGIVYQIFVDGMGWLEPKSDGEEAMYSKTSPMSAFRMVFIPQTEKQYIIDMWNRDVGTMNVD